MPEWIIGAVVALFGVVLGWALSEVSRSMEEKRWR